MVKRLLTVVIILAALAVSAFFTSLNPGELRLDLGFATMLVPVGLAFVFAIAIGWLIGILSTLFWVARVSMDRRRLRARLGKTSDGALGARNDHG